MFNRNFKNKLYFIAAIFLGITAGIFLDKVSVYKEREDKSLYLKRLFPRSGHLANPLIQIETPEGGDAKLESIKCILEGYIRSSIKNGKASTISIYLRDLDKGTWTGINENDGFAAGSLLKIPVMIAYLKKAEEDPAILDKEIEYKTEINTIPQNIAPQNSAQLGNTYTVDKLLRYMIVDSDNISSILLFNNIDIKLIAKVYSDLQLSVPDLEEEHRISAKEYATFFRVLYNVTYLDEELSEKALKLLTEASFRDGIVAGIPANITVAHKFAERKYTTRIDKQLHDCGIVYCPKGPYLICVMTKGKDFNALKGIIKDISRITYAHMEKMIPLFYSDLYETGEPVK